jgi:hypothetical protein
MTLSDFAADNGDAKGRAPTRRSNQSNPWGDHKGGADGPQAQEIRQAVPHVPQVNECCTDGKPVMVAKYSGLHPFASWCINRKTDGGLELPTKVVQERLGSRLDRHDP